MSENCVEEGTYTMNKLRVSIREIENGFLVESTLRETVHAPDLQGVQDVLHEIFDEYKRIGSEDEEQRMLEKIGGHHGRTLRDRMQVAISTFVDLEKQEGIVQESNLYVAIARKLGDSQEAAKELIDKLIKEGILYSPKPGLIKRTAA
jgi:hypothetical protein